MSGIHLMMGIIAVVVITGNFPSTQPKEHRVKKDPLTQGIIFFTGRSGIL